MNPQKRVLFVDDDSTHIMAMREVFGPHYDVLTAYDGPEGLEVAVAECPDLVVTGLHMPQMDGMEFIRRLRVVQPQVPIIMLTGAGSAEDRREAFVLGVCEFLDKPSSKPELTTAIERALASGSKG